MNDRITYCLTLIPALPLLAAVVVAVLGVVGYLSLKDKSPDATNVQQGTGGAPGTGKRLHERGRDEHPARRLRWESKAPLLPQPRRRC